MHVDSCMTLPFKKLRFTSSETGTNRAHGTAQPAAAALFAAPDDDVVARCLFLVKDRASVLFFAQGTTRSGEERGRAGGCK